MVRVSVTYKDGSVWTCDVQPMGTADTSRACASSCHVKLDHDGRLVYEPRILVHFDNEWKSPQAGLHERVCSYSVDATDPDVPLPHDTDVKADASVVSHREFESKSTHLPRYTLRDTAELKGAVSVTVDGVLAYVEEDGRLVSASGGGLGGGQASEGGMVDDFATTNHPEPYRGADALAHEASQGGEGHEY